MLGRQLLNRLGVLPPFEVGIAPQGTQTRARRIHQHPVYLAGEAFDAVIAFMGNGHRVDVGQAAACQPRLERIEPVTRGVKGVEASGIAHRGTDGQRFASGTGTKVHHHFAAFRVKQQGQQLRALVLHFNRTPREGVELAQLRLVHQAQAPRGVRRRYRFNSMLAKFLLNFCPFFLQYIDPQIQPCRGIETFHQRPEVVTQLSLQRLYQPLRQVMAVQLHQV